MDREALFERCQALHLPGDEDGRIDQKRSADLLDQGDALCFEVTPARRRKANLGSGRKDDLALLPGLGVDDEREPLSTTSLEERLEPSVMVGMSVRDDQRT
jgi:hypothetical protein